MTNQETADSGTIDPDMTKHETIGSDMTNHETSAHGTAAVEELVVLCAPDGSAAGTAPKLTVHHRDTPLHLAFSCYVFDPAGRVLVTRRAYEKRTFPGIRTNSCCGHPGPAEGMRLAVLRRLQQELGVVPSTLDLILPGFRYRATAADGTVENELCPVYRAVIPADVQVVAARTEVHDAWWMSWEDLVNQVGSTDQLGSTDLSGRTDQLGRTDEAGSDPLSLWCTQQVLQLSVLGSDPLSWPAGESAMLPSAATP